MAELNVEYKRKLSHTEKIPQDLSRSLLMRNYDLVQLELSMMQHRLNSEAANRYDIAGRLTNDDALAEQDVEQASPVEREKNIPVVEGRKEVSDATRTLFSASNEIGNNVFAVKGTRGEGIERNTPNIL